MSKVFHPQQLALNSSHISQLAIKELTDHFSYPAVVFLVEYLWRQHVPLPFLLLPLGPHVVAGVLHPGGGDVHGLEPDAQGLQDHEDPLLVGHDLKKEMNCC